jgi:hypothetical protein
LADTGFADIRVTPTLGEWSIVGLSVFTFAELEEAEMTERDPRTSFQELRASVSRVRGAGTRLAERIQRTAETYRGQDSLARLATDVRGVRDQLLQQAEHVLQDIEGRRARTVNRIERQTARLVAQGVKRLNLATEAGVEQLRVRVAECERRLGEREVEAYLPLEEVRGEPIDGDRSL